MPAAGDPIYVALLDGERLEDYPFLQSLARALAPDAEGAPKPPILLVHGSEGVAERALEAEAYFPERDDNGRLPLDSDAERQVCERAVRDYTSRLVGMLTDAGVHAVGMQGTDRRLLNVDSEGGVEASGTEWLGRLAQQGGVPVVSAMGRAGEATEEAAPLRAAATLARALDGCLLLFSRTNRSQLQGADDEALGHVAADALEPHRDALPNADLALDEARAGTPLFVTNLASLRRGAPLEGTRVGA